ncbi:hypothetical protein STAQ_40730 [Allostella sp. ATCC 35155]|nr:hypothetical protein STAQ_40730 [Stella sp. ATCC 35155]
MRRLLMIMMLCLVPTLSFAQSAPSVTITPPTIETNDGITLKQAAVVVAAVAAGALAGQWIIGNAVGTWIGAAAGGIAGLWVYDEYAPEIDDL